ncbi:hypothetical protein L3K57_15740 (plasmid) [Enterococcus faecium]|uniref:hypothetical protein n=1 Tax=Enterococcus faecium TaxID=1352 RepID=UPI001F24A282|nr:hypothetical protein [Enterococcus faecium]UJV65256.1 hypothetical protein L3K57_15740 [Enterococcus faecium]
MWLDFIRLTVALVILTCENFSTIKKQIISNHNQETVKSDTEVDPEEEVTEQAEESQRAGRNRQKRNNEYLFI